MWRKSLNTFTISLAIIMPPIIKHDFIFKMTKLKNVTVDIQYNKWLLICISAISSFISKSNDESQIINQRKISDTYLPTSFIFKLPGISITEAVTEEKESSWKNIQRWKHRYQKLQPFTYHPARRTQIHNKLSIRDNFRDPKTRANFFYKYS